ncbi:MAG: hypothetical protein BWZ10_03042 [candidate division BRC1 bacterium ADurb.BinA364]|nr:MAG: hypothetical protein BWZ10_03042 [candidate division BRC1 bacterium ADurb.BinA364]
MLDSYLRAGMNRLFAMQTPMGGLSFWPGGYDPYPYGSLYALHFLTLAKAGREIAPPQANFEALQEYARTLMRDWTSSTPSALYTRAYAVYVLALDGDAEALRAIERFDSLELPRSARLWLAAALARNTRDFDRVNRYLSQAPSYEEGDTRESAGTLASPIRTDAIELMALEQMGADEKILAAKANALLAYLSQAGRATTQETAFVVSALSGYLGRLGAKAQNPKAEIEGPDGKQILEGTKAIRRVGKGGGARFSVRNTGGAPLYVGWTTRGVPAKAEAVEAASMGGLSVRRDVYDTRGMLKEGAFLQGETAVVALRIDTRGPVENLVVADLLPGGFEIQNPSLSAQALPPEAQFQPSAEPTRVEMRDDRLVIAFDNVQAGQRLFYYLISAVTPGEYAWPPVEAEAMYDAAIRATTASGNATVEAR